MMRIRYFFFACLLLITIAACKTAQRSMLVSNYYEENKNETVLTLFPLGNVRIPGKWKQTSYDKVSRQYFFDNEDSTHVAVTLNPVKEYPFYQSTFTDSAFTAAFVKWDVEFWNGRGTDTRVIDDQISKGYIIWKVNDTSGRFVNTIFLYGAKRRIAYNFSGSSRRWSDEQLQTFLTALFNNN